MSQEVLDAVDASSRRFQDGQAVAARLEGGKLEDSALAAAYDTAIASITQAQAGADQAYNGAFSQFNVMENLRGRLNNAMQSATDKLNEAWRYISEHQQQLSNGPVQLLQQARQAMPNVQQGANAQTVTSWIAAAERARDLANRAENAASREFQDYEQEQQRRDGGTGADIGAQIALGVLGAILSSGLRSRSSGGSPWGSWGGGGGGGGHTGGGGGFSGGGWGGGGSSGGGWGGGGSSGGGWGGGGSSSGGW
jgi:hypothetical protein